MLQRVVTVLLVVLPACGEANTNVPASSQDPPPAPPAEVRLADAPSREDPAALTHRVFVQACGQCHIGRTSQQPAALGIFDLEDPDWVDGISKEGLESIPERLEATKLDPTDREATIAYISTIYADKPCA